MLQRSFCPKVVIYELNVAAMSIASLSSMEMFDVGPTIAKVSRTEVPWMGSTSGATVANVSNVDVFEVGANIVLELPHSTNVSQDRGSWLFLPARAWDIILGSGRERARAKKSSSLHSVCLGSLNGEPQEAYSLGGATGEEVVYIVY